MSSRAGDDSEQADGAPRVEMFDVVGPGVGGRIDGAPASTVGYGRASASEGEPGDPFTDEVTKALRDVVGRERTRVAEETERRHKEQLERVRGDAAEDEQRITTSADAQLDAIRRWVDGETARIRQEAESREERVREQRDSKLAAHRAAIEAAVDSLEQTVATHQQDVDRYFAVLEADAVTRIALGVAGRPEFPNLGSDPGSHREVPEGDEPAPLSHDEQTAQARWESQIAALAAESDPTPVPAPLAPNSAPPHLAPRPAGIHRISPEEVLARTDVPVPPSTFRFSGEDAGRAPADDEHVPPFDQSTVGRVLSRLNPRR